MDPFHHGSGVLNIDRPGKKMDNRGEKGGSMFLDQVFPETLTLTLTQRPYLQSQDDSWAIRDLTFVDYDLFVGLGGGAVFRWGDQEFLVEEGTALLVPPGVKLQARKVSKDNFRALAQHFEFTRLGTSDVFNEFHWAPWVRFERWSWVCSLLDGYGDSSPTGPGRGLVEHAVFRALILEFSRQAWTADQPLLDPHHGFVFRMARDIESGAREESTLNRVLEGVPCSADYACRLFKKQFGLSPARYQIRCRIRTAADLLASGMAVKEAAYAVGYDDQLYFSRVFTKIKGMSPRAYQSSLGIP